MRNKYLKEKIAKSKLENHPYQENSKVPYQITVNKNKELKKNILRNKNSFSKYLSKRNTEADLSKILEKSIQNVVIPDKIEHKTEKIIEQEKNKDAPGHITISKSQITKYIMHKQKSQYKLYTYKNDELNNENNSLKANNISNKIYIPKKLEKSNTPNIPIFKDKKDMVSNHSGNFNKMRIRKKTLCGLSMFTKNTSILKDEKTIKENPNKTEALIIQKNENGNIIVSETASKSKKLKKNRTSDFYKTMNSLRNSEVKSHNNPSTKNTITSIKPLSPNNSKIEDLKLIKKRNQSKYEEDCLRKTHTSNSINATNKHSFQYLLHQAHNNIDISSSFNRCYEKRQTDSNQVSDDDEIITVSKKKSDSLTNRTLIRNTQTGLSIFTKMNGFKSFRNKNRNKILQKNDGTSPVILESKRDNNTKNFIGVDKNNEKINISNKIINNTSKNDFNTFNNQKMKQSFVETSNLFIDNIKQIIFIQKKL